MGKSKVIISFVFVLVFLLMFMSLVSAGWWSDLFGKFTGRVTGNETDDCKHECSSSGSKECVGDGISYRTCGEYDSDDCLEWDVGTCGSGESCYNGFCVSESLECFDSDGGKGWDLQGNTYGTDESGSFSYYDSCNDDYNLLEYHCSPTVAGDYLTTSILCSSIGYDVCQDGACVQNTSSSTSSTCTDSDSGNDVYNKGTTCGDYCKTDHCDYGTILVEFYCSNNQMVNSSSICPTGYDCEDGVCATNSTSTTSTCTDSDGGNDVFNKGTTCGDFCNTDHCDYGIYIVEFYCSNDQMVNSSSICPTGYDCENGNCITNSTETNSDNSTTTTTTTTTTPTLSPTPGVYTPSEIPTVEGEIKTVEEEVEEGFRIVKETRKFVDQDGNEVEIESNVRIGEDGSSVREEERTFTDENGNEIGIKIKTEIRADGTVITDEDRSFVNRDGNLVEVKIRFESKDGSIKLKREIVVEGTGIESELEIVERFEDGVVKLKANLSDGREQEIGVMPDRASEIVSEELSIIDFEIELEEVEVFGERKAVYVAKGDEGGRFLGLFRVKLRLEAQIDSETGDVIDVKRPWWAFLVRGDEQDSGIDVSISDEENETIDDDTEVTFNESG
jgi:hypothetical protein